METHEAKLKLEDDSRFWRFDEQEFRRELGRHKEALLLEHEWDHYLPFKPVSSDPSKPVRIAFFGLNAHCEDRHFREHAGVNFFKSVQEGNYTKLKNVLASYMAEDGIDPRYLSGGAVYYSNVFKIVLRKEFFSGEKDVVSLYARKENENFKNLLMKWMAQEISRLHSDGCRIFVVFGAAAESFVRESKWPIEFVREKHFSRYTKSATREKIEGINKQLCERL